MRPSSGSVIACSNPEGCSLLDTVDRSRIDDAVPVTEIRQHLSCPGTLAFRDTASHRMRNSFAQAINGLVIVDRYPQFDVDCLKSVPPRIALQ
ncbi:hypothetical protein CSB45_07060 [candidate division KSB3 bacterium]|uniref:Uncharacterized protein n=1 Tax=candidate division KSB3 bacterium TaxID=2044937 RepID=A0A2G6E6J7_9BACT|nr:MAG: hypothetical protein CSB45_07060 [candidate division KSB3 bacterium]